MEDDRTARRRAWRLMLEAHAATTELLSKELEAEVGIPLGWYDVLLQLNGAVGGCMRMIDLAQAVLLSKSGLTRLVDRMETEQLVARRPAAADKRSFEVTMTAKGEELFRRAARVHGAGIDRHWTGLM